MSPIDPIGAGASSRATHAATPAPAARSGTDKAAALQPPATDSPAVAVETTQAVMQAQASSGTLLRPEPPPAQVDLAIPPMTAVLLHELRLQQELADVQARKEEKAG